MVKIAVAIPYHSSMREKSFRLRYDGCRLRRSHIVAGRKCSVCRNSCLFLTSVKDMKRHSFSMDEEAFAGVAGVVSGSVE